MPNAVFPADGRIISPFGQMRANAHVDAQGRRRPHMGVDINGPLNSPIRAFYPGVVRYIWIENDPNINRRSPIGNAIAIEHRDIQKWSLYAHMNYISNGITRNTQVEAGTLLGGMGKTSNGHFPSTCIHLHFEVRSTLNDRQAASVGGSRNPWSGSFGGGDAVAVGLDPVVVLGGLGLNYRDGRPDPSNTTVTRTTVAQTISVNDPSVQNTTVSVSPSGLQREYVTGATEETPEIYVIPNEGELRRVLDEWSRLNEENLTETNYGQFGLSNSRSGSNPR